jgi:GPI ethanolamine phosphate transferase 1
MPFAYRVDPNTNYMHRLMVIFLTFAPTFVILTISYEGLFYVAFCITLVTWVRLEHQIHVHNKAAGAPAANGKTANGAANGTKAVPTTGSPATTTRPLTISDARVALFFMVLVQSAFFSTGNVASISSFSLESVSRLIPVFDPFSQGALLILKIMIPFAVISANLGVLNVRLGLAPSALLMLVTATTDVLTLYFFWVVRDEGSWLEIGSTISHFVIASLLCLFIIGLESVSAAFIAGIEVLEGQGEDKAKKVEGVKA